MGKGYKILNRLKKIKMSPETDLAIGRETVSQEENSFRDVTERAKTLIGLFNLKGIPLTGRAMTGPTIRESRQKLIIICGGKDKRERWMHIGLSRIPKAAEDRLITWVGDITFRVPIITTWSFSKGYEEIWDWQNPKVRLSLKTVGHAVNISPADPVTGDHVLADFDQITRILEETMEAVRELDGQRKVEKDLAGKTLIID